MRNEADFLDRAIGRVRVAMWGLAGAGTIAAFFWQGWPWALGFLAGAAVSIVNFRWLHNLVASLGDGGRRPSKRMLLFLSVRYLLLGLGGYVIVKCLGVNLAAALAGLFVAIAAVILEILYELIYART